MGCAPSKTVPASPRAIKWPGLPSTRLRNSVTARVPVSGSTSLRPAGNACSGCTVQPSRLSSPSPSRSTGKKQRNITKESPAPASGQREPHARALRADPGTVLACPLSRIILVRRSTSASCSARMPLRRSFAACNRMLRQAAALGAVWLAGTSLQAGRTPERLLWKPIAPAVLKLDDRPANNWSIYQAERQTHLLLVVLDNRAHAVYRPDPKLYERHRTKLLGPGPDENMAIVATTHWDVGDVGPATQIRFYFPAERHWLTIQVPHQGPG